MGDEHLNAISVMELNEFIKSSVENLVPNPSECKCENGCDVLACFTTFSNILFDAEYEFDSSDDQLLSDEDFLEEIFSNPLFEEEIISTKIDPHHFDAESDLIESMINRDSSIISSSSKINSLLDELAVELTLLKSIPPGIDEIDCDHENEFRLTKRLLYDNSSPRPAEEFVSENSNADIESFSPSPIPVEDSDSFMEEIDLFLTPDDPMPPSIKDDDDDSERDVPILEELPNNMSRDVLTVGSTMRIPLLYRGEYSQWVERFMNYLEEQTDGEAMINSIKNCDQPLPRVTQVIQNIDRLARSLLIQGLPNDIYSLIDSNKTAKDLWDALTRHMLGFEYGEQDRKAIVLYEYETFKATEGELLLDTYIRYLQGKQYATMMRKNKNLMDINNDALYNILKQNQGDVDDAMGSKKKTVVISSDPLALIAEKTKVSKSKEKVVVSSDSKGTNKQQLEIIIYFQSANKKQEFVKTNNKNVEKKDAEKKRDMSKVKCYNCKTEGHFAKDCKKVKVNYYKAKMLLAKKDKDEKVLLAEDQAWMESSSD
nr:integrase, catalytic region, zinc finger, CCHC-type, peptidase aspartic, catalytic [Tanacetum cinerariifolium]